jgi:hypothetical protein
VQNSLQSRIGRYDLSRKAALGQTDRGLLEKGIEFGLGRLPRPGDFGDCTHGFTLLGIKVGRKREWAASDLGFPKMGRITATSAPVPNPTIDRRSCASEGQMSPKTEIILWKTREGTSAGNGDRRFGSVSSLSQTESKPTALLQMNDRDGLIAQRSLTCEQACGLHRDAVISYVH